MTDLSRVLSPNGMSATPTLSEIFGRDPKSKKIMCAGDVQRFTQAVIRPRLHYLRVLALQRASGDGAQAGPQHDCARLFLPLSARPAFLLFFFPQ